MSTNDLDLHLDQGVQLYRNSQYKQASIAFQQVLNYAKKTDNQKAIIYSYLAIGDCFFYLRDLDDALSHFVSARILSEQINDKNNHALSLVNLAKVVFVKEGHISQAGYYLMEAIQIFNELNDNLGLLYAYCIAGELEMNQGNSEAAKEYFERASIMAQLSNKEHLQEYFTRRAEDRHTYIPPHFMSQ